MWSGHIRQYKQTQNRPVVAWKISKEKKKQKTELCYEETRRTDFRRIDLRIKDTFY